MTARLAAAQGRPALAGTFPKADAFIQGGHRLIVSDQGRSTRSHLLWRRPTGAYHAADPAVHSHSIVDRGIADVALQRRLGILPERRARTSAFDTHHSRRGRSDLGREPQQNVGTSSFDSFRVRMN